MDTLPQELIDAIIDTLARDAETLKSCSLVSKSFFPRAHKLLFSTIILEPKETSKRNPSAEFLHLLCQSKTVAPIVRNLTLFNFSCGRTSWFSQDTTIIPQILDALPNLTKVTLSGRHYDRRWDGSSDMNAALCRAFSRPQLTSLSLIYMSFLQPADFLLLFDNCPNLQELRLLNVYISDQFTLHLPQSLPHPNIRRPQIESLLIQNVPFGLIDMIHDALDLSCLRKLQLWSDHDTQSAAVQSLLEGAGDSLEQVLFHGFSSSTSGLDISHIPRIKCYFSNFHSANHSVLSGLTGLFFQRYPRHTSRMRSVTFHVRCHPKAIIDCPGSEWARLEDAMAHVSETVRFELPVRDLKASRDDPLENACVDAVKKGLPLLQAKGLLEVVMVQMFN